MDDLIVTFKDLTHGEIQTGLASVGQYIIVYEYEKDTGLVTKFGTQKVTAVGSAKVSSK